MGIDPKATYLVIREPLKSLEPLLQARNLEALWFRAGTLPDLTPLAQLKKLDTLTISERARVKDLTPISKFPALQELELSAEYAKLATVKRKLRQVTLTGATLKNVDCLRGISGIEELELGSALNGQYVALNDSAKFPKMPELRRLDILSRALTTLKPLAPLTGVRALWVSANKRLRSLSGIESMSKLRYLGADRSSVAELPPQPLELLGLASTKVKSLKGLNVSRLKQLYLSQTPLRSLEGLERAPLEILDLGRCDKLQDLSPLSSLPKLKCLCLNGVSADLSPLRSLTKLEAISLRDVDLQDFDLLMELPALKEVYLYPLAKSPKSQALDKQLKKRRGALYDSSYLPNWKHYPRAEWGEGFDLS
jgi:Leucine-rich repeat (LRR) protein